MRLRRRRGARAGRLRRLGAFTKRWSRRFRWVRRGVVVGTTIAGVNTALKRRAGGGTDFGPAGGAAGDPSRPPHGGPSPSPLAAAAVPSDVGRSPAAAPAVAVMTAPTAVGAGGWIVATGDVAPAGYPIKANMNSGIFHVPGGLSYERTHADRWYASAEAAAADGLRQAKR